MEENYKKVMRRIQENWEEGVRDGKKVVTIYKNWQEMIKYWTICYIFSWVFGWDAVLLGGQLVSIKLLSAQLSCAAAEFGNKIKEIYFTDTLDTRILMILHLLKWQVDI